VKNDGDYGEKQGKEGITLHFEKFKPAQEPQAAHLRDERWKS
jgi:hypothetical protein